MPNLNTIRFKLQDKNVEERANIKSIEIAKFDFGGKYTKDDIEVEIIGDIKAINGGIELFARAWKNEKQLGFGKDGSVEIERFRFYNPPILTEDKNGDIIREWIEDGEIKQRKLIEDPVKAIKNSLAHTISLVGKENTKITIGKIGNTTSNFYPSAGNVSPSDAVTYFTDNSGQTFAFIRAAAGGGVSQNSPSVLARISADGGGIADRYDNITRAIYGFDTSTLTGEDISSATLSLFGSGSKTDLNQSIVIDRNIPADPAEIVASDHNLAEWDSVEQSSTRINISAWNDAAYNVFTLNGTGIGNINKTGLTWFGSRSSGEFDNDPPTWTADTDDCSFEGHQADSAGTDNDPKLVVEHESAPVEKVLTEVVSLVSPSLIKSSSYSFFEYPNVRYLFKSIFCF